MDLRRLSYFTVVARHLHFGRAADEIGVSQPGLSQQIKVLERELQVTLFERDKKSVSLTVAGAALLDGATALLNQSDALRERARAAARGLAGVLRVAYTRSGFELQIGDLVRGFARENPGVDVEAHTGWTSWNLELLRDRKLDVAFVRGPVQHNGIDVLTIGTEDFVVAIPEGHPLAGRREIERSALRDEPIVLWHRHQGSAFYDRLIEQVWPDAEPRLVAQEPEAEQILAAVADGTGLSVLDRRRSEKLCPDAGVVLRPFAGRPPTVNVGLAWRSGDDSPTVQAFTSWCRDDQA